MLTKVLQVRRLLDQPVDLVLHIQLLARLEVAARQLLLDAGQNLQRARVLHFLGLGIVGRGCDAGPVPTRAADHGAHVFGPNDGLASLGGERRLRWGFAVAEAPGEEGIVDELLCVSIRLPDACQGSGTEIVNVHTASSTAITDSLFVLNTRITCSHVVR